MKGNERWLLAAAAVIMLAFTWLDNDFSVFQNLSGADFAPVIAITAVTFLVKTGVLSAVLIGLKKLWERIRKK